MNPHDHSEHVEECLEQCSGCHDICVTTASYCLGMGGKHAQPGHIRALLDCAQICATSADFMLRGSPLHGHTCGACAPVCLACAESCESVDPEDEMMARCAEACRACADSCGVMAAMMTAGASDQTTS